MDYTFRRTWSMAHRFYRGCDSPRCMTPHGHTWAIVWVVGTNRHDHDGFRMAYENGTNMFGGEFALLKKPFHDWIDNYLDHTFALNRDDPLREHMINNPNLYPGMRFTLTPGDPTTEMLGLLLWSKLAAFLLVGPHKDKLRGLWVKEVYIEETATNAVKLFRDDYRLFREICKIDERNWWNNTSNSTTDLAPWKH